MEVGEVWKDIIGYKGLYQVSNSGKVKSLHRRRRNKHSTAIVYERLLKIHISARGYIRARLCKNNAYTNFSVHRLVAIAFIPNPENKPCVNHINGIKTDNRIENLEWVTLSENAQHAIKNGLKMSRKGSDNPMAKLTNEQVLEIRKIGKSKTQEELGLIYGVDRRTIGKVLNRQKYNNI